jgi:hypothetical protein
MLQNKNQAAYRLGAVFYVLWGLLHIIAAVRAYQLGAAQEPGMVQGKLYQNAWNMGYLALFSIVIAVVFNWRNSLTGYWLNLITVSVTDIGFIVLLLIPGYSTDLIGPVLWLLGAVFSTIGIRTAPQMEQDPLPKANSNITSRKIRRTS